MLLAIGDGYTNPVILCMGTAVAVSAVWALLWVFNGGRAIAGNATAAAGRQPGPPRVRRSGYGQKYAIEDPAGTPAPVGALYFVLRFDAGAEAAHQRASRAAIRAYVENVCWQVTARLIKDGQYDHHPILQTVTDLQFILREHGVIDDADQSERIRPTEDGSAADRSGMAPGRRGTGRTGPDTQGEVRVPQREGSPGEVEGT